MLQMVLSCIGFGVETLASLYVVATRENARDVAVPILLVCAVALVLTIIYWSQLRKTVKSAKAALQNRHGRIKVGMFSVVMLILGTAVNVIELLLKSSVSSSLAFIRSEFYGFGSVLPASIRSIYESIVSLFFPQTGTVSTLLEILSVTTPVLVVMILLKPT